MDELIYEITTDDSSIKLEKKSGLYCLYIVFDNFFYFYYDYRLDESMEMMYLLMILFS